MKNFFSFYQKMQSENILFSFQGEITVELVESILRIMEVNLENAGEETRIKKKVYYVLVECLQNLYHHLEDAEASGTEELKIRNAIFMIGKIDNTYNIMTGNYIKNENTAALEIRLNEINSFSKEELKDHYMSILEKGEMSKKGGGGLGLIDIARKNGEKFTFSFFPVDDDYSFFELGIKISK